MPHAAFIIELSAPFWIPSKAAEIVRKTKPPARCVEKNTEVVQWKIGEVKIEDFQFVQVIEEHTVTFEI